MNMPRYSRKNKESAKAEAKADKTPKRVSKVRKHKSDQDGSVVAMATEQPESGNKTKRARKAKVGLSNNEYNRSVARNILFDVIDGNNNAQRFETAPNAVTPKKGVRSSSLTCEDDGIDLCVDADEELDFEDFPIEDENGPQSVDQGFEEVVNAVEQQMQNEEVNRSRLRSSSTDPEIILDSAVAGSRLMSEEENFLNRNPDL